MNAPKFDVQSDFPCAFECTGELVYGQMQCVYLGLNTNLHDGMDKAVDPQYEGGTIIQRGFQYRVAARVGRWIVSRVFIGKEDDSVPNGFVHDQKSFVGYVLHHEDVSAIEYVRRASKVGWSNRNDHENNEGIVYINRYDWSNQYGMREWINIALGPGRPHTVDQISGLMEGRLFVVDVAKSQPFIETLQHFCPERKCYLLNDSASNAPYGIHLVSAPGTQGDYELGWLGFSGKKHEHYSESDELVAMVYDPTYFDFNEIQATEAIMVEDAVARLGRDIVIEYDEELKEYSKDIPDSDSDTDDESKTVRLPPAIANVCYGEGERALINITGTNLSRVDDVYFGSEDVPFEVVSNKLIEVDPPREIVGKVVVKLRSPAGVSKKFHFNARPIATIFGLTPEHGSQWGGTLVKIWGLNLEKTTEVLFGHIPALSFKIVSDTQINALAPAGLLRFSDFAVVSLRSDYLLGNLIPYGRIFTYEKDSSPPKDNYRLAITTWKREIEKNSEDYDIARCELGKVYEATRDYDALVSLWEEVLPLYPDENANNAYILIMILNKLANAYVLQGKFDMAITTWKKAIERGTDDKHIFLGLADAYEKKGDVKEAERMRSDAERIWQSRN